MSMICRCPDCNLEEDNLCAMCGGSQCFWCNFTGKTQTYCETCGSSGIVQVDEYEYLDLIMEVVV